MQRVAPAIMETAWDLDTQASWLGTHLPVSVTYKPCDPEQVLPSLWLFCERRGMNPRLPALWGDLMR